ncbi:MAG: hypothetical protein HPY74_02455 [Firmicutes bacterium]|nr:hypothetical protein [Bacillota bacterium]
MKRKLIKKVILILLSGLIVLVSFSETFAHPSSQSGIISWGEDIGWSIDENNHTNGTTITYDFRSGVESQYQTITINGAAKWSIINIVRTSSPVGEVYTYSDENSYTVAAFCEYSSDSNGHLTNWKIKINTAKNPTEVTMAHEFGHAAGLNDLIR